MARCLSLAEDGTCLGLLGAGFVSPRHGVKFTCCRAAFYSQSFPLDPMDTVLGLIKAKPSVTQLIFGSALFFLIRGALEP